MTEAQRALARHALGLPNRRGVSYRNAFVAGVGHEAYGHWTAMVAAGEAERRDASTLHFGGDDLFWLTPAGARAAVSSDEQLSAEDFPA